MSGTRKRRGTTLLELSLVIAILGMIALPFAAFVSQNLKNTVQSSAQLKEQMVLEQVMQDMEKHLRSAIRVKSDGTSCPITFPMGGISFTSRDPQALIGNVPTPTLYTYVLAIGLLEKNNVTFPDGLEAGLITSLTFPAGPEQQNLGTTAPCYITVRIEAYDTTLQTTTALQKTIYLRNYTSIVDIAKIGLTAPVKHATPVTTITATAYTGIVTWKPDYKFNPNGVYIATITLTANIGFTFAGVGVNFFTVDGAASVTNPAGSGTTIVVTATFPEIQP